MSIPIVECVANFSEARRPEIIQAIAQAIQSVPQVSLLDQHSDLDHNRTVLTFSGPPVPVEEAAYRAIAKAVELINLEEHTGEHPRIGAADVVPFVPISGISMAECIAIARRLGQRVGAELRIPVYLYEEAATRPERQNLEYIRRGQYEGLKSEIETNPERLPDFGPARCGPAGATVIGARHALVAFNVYLTSADLQIARKIAKTIRSSSGGLRYVKALGMLVDGRAQVSMNLTNFRLTPLAQVVEMIRREAGRYGVAIHHSELVGLIPQDALVDAAQWYMQLDQFEGEQVLERRLFGASPSDPGEKYPFLDNLADGTPTPGGGSAAAYAGAAGAALTAMVARLTIGKKKYAGVEAEMNTVLGEAETLRNELTQAIQRDAHSFEAVMEAYRLPKSTPDEMTMRDDAVQAATRLAAQIPLEVARKAVRVIELALLVVSKGNLNAISDGASGAAMAQAALTGAGYNVRANALVMQDPTTVENLLSELSALENHAIVLNQQVRDQMLSRAGISR